jgi:hypothetical protein
MHGVKRRTERKVLKFFVGQVVALFLLAAPFVSAIAAVRQVGGLSAERSSAERGLSAERCSAAVRRCARGPPKGSLRNHSKAKSRVVASSRCVTKAGSASSRSVANTNTSTHTLIAYSVHSVQINLAVPRAVLNKVSDG